MPKLDNIRFNIAQVGYTGSDDDRDRELMVQMWLERINHSYFRKTKIFPDRPRVSHDYLNLNDQPPRDFLTEKQCYDIVIIHNLWSITELLNIDSNNGAATSKLHRPDAWISRLRSTQAQYIFIIGSDFTVYDLGKTVQGYHCVEVPSSQRFGVFIAEELFHDSYDFTQAILYTDLSEARVASLQHLISNEYLDISDTSLTLEHFKIIMQMKTLQQLHLANTSFDADNLEYITPLNKLRILNLDGTTTNDAALEGIAKIRTLEYLSLNATEVSDEGIQKLRSMPLLEHLSFIKN